MARQRRLSDLPDFLQNSPFLPLATADDDDFNTLYKVQARPSLKQILRSKRIRTTLIFITVFIALITFASKIRRYHPLARLGITGPKCYFSEPVITPVIPDGSIDWSQFAYTQYVTNRDYLCNSLMIFETLNRLGSKADRILLFPSTLINSIDDIIVDQLLGRAKTEYNVKLIPIEEQHKTNVHRIWASSYTKLLAFNQTQYTRLLHLDSDSTLLVSLDALFFLPPSPLIVPRAYWLPAPKLSSHIMLLQPSSATFSLIQTAITAATRGTYDMEIINSLFGDKCSLLPQNEYALLTGEFRRNEHKGFLGDEKWDTEMVMREAKFVHFSDYPFPKPWEEATVNEQEAATPKCEFLGRPDCRGRDIWVGFYENFKMRRKSICGLDDSPPSNE